MRTTPRMLMLYFTAGMPAFAQLRIICWICSIWRSRCGLWPSMIAAIGAFAIRPKAAGSAPCRARCRVSPRVRAAAKAFDGPLFVERRREIRAADVIHAERRHDAQHFVFIGMLRARMHGGFAGGRICRGRRPLCDGGFGAGRGRARGQKEAASVHISNAILYRGRREMAPALLLPDRCRLFARCGDGDVNGIGGNTVHGYRNRHHASERSCGRHSYIHLVETDLRGSQTSERRRGGDGVSVEAAAESHHDIADALKRCNRGSSYAFHRRRSGLSESDAINHQNVARFGGMSREARHAGAGRKRKASVGTVDYSSIARNIARKASAARLHLR